LEFGNTPNAVDIKWESSAEGTDVEEVTLEGAAAKKVLARGGGKAILPGSTPGGKAKRLNS